MRIVTLTGQEEGFFKQLMVSREAMEKKILNGFSDGMEEELRRYLKLLYANLSKSDEPRD